MRYVRSPILHHSLSRDGQTIDNAALIAARQSFVDQFNAAMEAPAGVVEEMQADFVNGKMTHDEMVSYVRFCEYMIGVVQERLADDAN